MTKNKGGKTSPTRKTISKKTTSRRSTASSTGKSAAGNAAGSRSSTPAKPAGGTSTEAEVAVAVAVAAPSAAAGEPSTRTATLTASKSAGEAARSGTGRRASSDWEALEASVTAVAEQTKTDMKDLIDAQTEQIDTLGELVKKQDDLLRAQGQVLREQRAVLEAVSQGVADGADVSEVKAHLDRRIGVFQTEVEHLAAAFDAQKIWVIGIGAAILLATIVNIIVR